MSQSIAVTSLRSQTPKPEVVKRIAQAAAIPCAGAQMHGSIGAAAVAVLAPVLRVSADTYSAARSDAAKLAMARAASASRRYCSTS